MSNTGESGSEANPSPTTPAPTPEEFRARRLDAWLGFWKIVIGTALVGALGIIVPQAVSYYSATVDSQRREAEARLAKETAHQQYIKEFFTTAINQDIELRIRFADYFAYLSDPDQQKSWELYRNSLVEQRKAKRLRIGELERELIDLKKSATDIDTARFDEVSRELEWTYAEVGYVPIDRSVVKPPTTRKERLYNETVAIARVLLARPGNIDPQSPDYVRFWELYNKDLIGVESLAFASKMVQIGSLLRSLAATPSPPTDELRGLVEDLSHLAIDETVRDSQAQAASPAAPAPAVEAQVQIQQQQQQQQQQQIQQVQIQQQQQQQQQIQQQQQQQQQIQQQIDQIGRQVERLALPPVQ